MLEIAIWPTCSCLIPKGCAPGLMVGRWWYRSLTMRRENSHMPYLFGYIIEGRVPVDLGLGRIEQHALLGRIGRGDGIGWHHPDRQTLAATGVDVARGLQCHGGIVGMQRADMPVRKPIAAANEDFPQRRIRRGHPDLPELFGGLCALPVLALFRVG